jgi:hypothetical protein
MTRDFFFLPHDFGCRFLEEDLAPFRPG